MQEEKNFLRVHVFFVPPERELKKERCKGGRSEGTWESLTETIGRHIKPLGIESRNPKWNFMVPFSFFLNFLGQSLITRPESPSLKDVLE